MRLYDEYIKRLIAVNDEDKTELEHRILKTNFDGWKRGVKDATGFHFNGDYYYIEQGIDRPMCCGEFLDWKSRQDATMKIKVCTNCGTLYHVEWARIDKDENECCPTCSSSSSLPLDKDDLKEADHD